MHRHILTHNTPTYQLDPKGRGQEWEGGANQEEEKWRRRGVEQEESTEREREREREREYRCETIESTSTPCLHGGFDRTSHLAIDLHEPSKSDVKFLAKANEKNKWSSCKT